MKVVFMYNINKKHALDNCYSLICSLASRI